MRPQERAPNYQLVAAWSALLLFIGAGAFALGMAMPNKTLAAQHPPLSLLKIVETSRKPQFPRAVPISSGRMVTILFALVSLLSFRFRSRASLELELLALRHQVVVLRRQRRHRLRLLSADRLLWVWLYRVRPQVLETLVLVKPATVVKWHRQGFRIYWRWRSRCPGRPKTSDEIRDLIRQMSVDNPLWGAPRVHGELLKLASTSVRLPLEGICLGAPGLPPRLGGAFCGTI